MCGGNVGREVRFEWTRYEIKEIKVILPRNSVGNGGRTNLDSILRSRDFTLPTKVRLVKAIVFPVVTYGCEIWTIKKVERRELMLLKYGVGENSSESLGLQGDLTSPS